MTERLIRKITSIIVISAMMLTVFTVPAAAKSKARLSKRKLTITCKKSTTIKITGTSAKARWSVSGKKLVSIKTKGKKRHKAVIKAGKKAGTCYIKVKAGRKTLKCKVIVKAAKKKTQPSPVPSPDPDEFKEKELSGTSVDKTASFKAEAVSGKETDDDFRLAMTDTSLSMLKYLCSCDTDRNKNILISPDSILTAMAMVENGAGTNTLDEMKAAFGGIDAEDFDAYLYTLNNRLTSSQSVKYHMANSIWYKNDKNDINVRDEFIQKNVNFFGAQIFEAPFSDDTLSDINNWVYNKTNGMIPSILNKLTPDTVMVLLNAIAFEGEWTVKYDRIWRESFYNESEAILRRSFMLKGTEDTYVNIDGAKGFVKPYKGGEIAFLGLETPSGMSVDDFLEGLTAQDYIEGYNEKTDKYDVVTKMPEFKYDYSESLVDTMKSLGIRDAFDEFSADFSGITPPEQRLFISDVLHKTHIELSTEGTKAAAATGVVMEKSTVKPPSGKPQIEVNLDHPFVYAIIDTKSGIPLFIGLLREPEDI